MIMASLRVVVPQERRNEILRTLRPLLGPTRVRQGCLDCRLYQDTEDENTYLFIQAWQSQATLESFIDSEEYRKILAVMDLAAQAPEVEFHTVSRTAGMEFVRTVRR
jgi:quinol monooxygenase YgiN